MRKFSSALLALLLGGWATFTTMSFALADGATPTPSPSSCVPGSLTYEIHNKVKVSTIMYAVRYFNGTTKRTTADFTTPYSITIPGPTVTADDGGAVDREAVINAYEQETGFSFGDPGLSTTYTDSGAAATLTMRTGQTYLLAEGLTTVSADWDSTTCADGGATTVVQSGKATEFQPMLISMVVQCGSSPQDDLDRLAEQEYC